MNASENSAAQNVSTMPNGSGAAAILAAGIGCFALGVLAIAGDKSSLLKSHLIFYKPTGPLSGVSTGAILIWLLAWALLEWRWRKRTVRAGRAVILAFILLGLSVLLTFPPIADLF